MTILFDRPHKSPSGTRRLPPLPPSPKRELPSNYNRLDYHEKLYYTNVILGIQHSPSTISSLKQIETHSTNHTLRFYPENAQSNLHLMSNKTVAFAHETVPVMSPTAEHVAAYRAGALSVANGSPVLSPLRIIKHNRRGSGPKGSNINGHHGVCRTKDGGFYAVA